MLRRAQVEALCGDAVVALYNGLLIVGLTAALVGCASGNVLQQTARDRSLVTGSISGPGQGDKLTDEQAVSNAVTGADVDHIGSDGISWNNPATGASGQITSIVEYQDKDLLCRRFLTSRASFDGVSLVHGDVCLGVGVGWHMRTFATS